MILPLVRWPRRWSVANPNAPGRTRRVLQLPVAAAPRIAVIAGGFSLNRGAREFAADDLPAIQRWSPEAIVTPLETALWLADERLRGRADLASLRCLVVLTDLGGEPLTDAYRELLWQSFGVPVFEQLRGADGAVMARECEVHDGLHLDPAARFGPEMDAFVTTEHCECGSELPRLKGYRGVPSAVLRPQTHPK